MKGRLIAVLVLGIAVLGAGIVVGTDMAFTEDAVAKTPSVGIKSINGWAQGDEDTMQIHWGRDGEPAGALGYHVYRSTNGVTYTKITSSPVWPDYYDEGLKAGVYYYMIYLVNSDGTETFWMGPLIGVIS